MSALGRHVGRPLRVQQILRACKTPFRFIRRPRSRDRRRFDASADLLERRLRSEQVRGIFQFELRSVALPQRRRDLEADTDRLQPIAVGDDHEDAVARLTAKLRAGRWRERDGIEADPGYIPRVQRGGERRAVDPRRAQLFERRVGAAANGDVRAFNRANARIQQWLSISAANNSHAPDRPASGDDC